MPPSNFLSRLPRSFSDFFFPPSSPIRRMPLETSIPKGYEELREGLARALYRNGQVFYNPAQVVNRDLSVLVLRWLSRERGKNLRVLEALSATGLRAIRYFKEVPAVTHVVANDLDENAVETIRRNVLHNSLDLEKDITPNHGDAIEVMTLARSKEKQYDVVDLDPYGSAAPFLDSAVQAVCDGGLLCVTCTDLAVLCGNSPEICYGRYASTPLKGPTAHEMAVRTVFAAIQTAANRHSRAVEAVVCVKIDFYVRLFVRVRDSRHLAQQTASNSSVVFQCGDCGTQRYQPVGRIKPNPVTNTARKKRRRMEKATEVTGGVVREEPTQNVSDEKLPNVKQLANVKYAPPVLVEHTSSACHICEGQMVMGGPIWSAALIGEGVAASLLMEIESGDGDFKARDRVGALVRLLEEEVKTIPLFMHLPSMCKLLRVSSPPAASVRAVLLSRGYEVSQSHTDPQALKTTAPPELVWDILRIWADKVGTPLKQTMEKNSEQQESKVKGNKNTSRPPAGARILRKEPILITKDEIDFGVKKDKFVRRGQNTSNTAVRFPSNPEPFWGPKARAGKRKASIKSGVE